mmetsp:Transcript_105668/g.187904  ORF Transcript_105668/g.187904 Transcript_105668/m.187904 type:complete len:372 (+) Transcript_105668:86-1201(+)|eukprot:CAMPEP_0197662380 /NCGR_PEP_ID=MMETSP1338-20131121/53149_1 /TAXON_ID=43686 ORGANISM="Pelagodinium beii, Strain RCC1491" /NCGR_SAMPLE_ID=MMETSP1338 /ASSEMBLY_ACC=CAM_ASM_000754 /LENGTH=371 /DNA_ID=CAMNT_0043240209 /DNA_START=88 /DNA_END=1203 /DNA_ORIENTATION=-
MRTFLGLFALVLQSDAVKLGQSKISSAAAPAPAAAPANASLNGTNASVTLAPTTTSMLIELDPNTLIAQASAEESIAIQQQVDAAVKKAEKEGFEEIKEAAHDAESKWVAEAHMMAAQGEHLAEEAKNKEIAHVQEMVQEKKHHQSEITDKMASQIETTAVQQKAEVVHASEEYARSATQNSVSEAVQGPVQELLETQAKVEETRKAAIAYSEDAITAAEKLDQIAKDSEALAANVKEAPPEAKSNDVLHDVQVGLDQAKHANALAQLSIATTEEAIKKANATYQMASLAKEEAKHLFDLSLEQEKKVDAIEARAKLTGKIATQSEAQSLALVKTKKVKAQAQATSSEVNVVPLDQDVELSLLSAVNEGMH